LHDVETFQNSMYQLRHTGYECKTWFRNIIFFALQSTATTELRWGGEEEV